MLFYFDFANYFKMIRLAWNEAVPKARFYYLTVLVLVVPVVSTFHAVCFFLDGILFPGLWKVKLVEPVFLDRLANAGHQPQNKSQIMQAGQS